MNELTDYEKLIEGVNQLANILSKYYAALIEKGFSVAIAERLTIEYQHEILNMANKK